MTDTCSQFIAELREIAAETQFEFSQSEWEDALIEGFRHDWKLARVLVTAARIPKEIALSPADWSALAQRASTLAPSLSPRTALANLARQILADAGGKTDRFIRARDLSKSHDWNTVK